MNGRKSNDILRKSRYGRATINKKFIDENQTSSRNLSRSVNGVLPKRTRPKNLSTSVSKSTINFKLGATNGFGIGDIVWAKMGKYPIWPGIISSDPESNNFSKSKYFY